MSSSHESFNKKNVRNKKEIKRKEKEKKRQERKKSEKSGNFEDMIAYVDENGRITSVSPDQSKKTDINPADIQISVPRQIPLDDSDPIRTGTVNFYNASKGFGFIKDAQTKQDVFVHSSNLLDEIHEGSLVTFEIIKNARGYSAVNVKLLKP